MFLPLKRDGADDWTTIGQSTPSECRMMHRVTVRRQALTRYHNRTVTIPPLSGPNLPPSYPNLPPSYPKFTLSYPNLPPVIPEGFYRVSRKNSGVKKRGFPMTNVGNDRRKTVADLILPDFVPEGPPPCPKPPLSYPKAFIGYPEKTMDSKGVDSRYKLAGMT